MHFAAAGFTNLTGDHLDYHKTMEHYAAAKAQALRDRSTKTPSRSINADERLVGPHGARLQGPHRSASASAKDADYQARDVAINAGGTNFVLVTPDGRAEVKMRLIGRHNIENALLAAALVGEMFGLLGASDRRRPEGRRRARRAGCKPVRHGPAVQRAGGLRPHRRCAGKCAVRPAAADARASFACSSAAAATATPPSARAWPRSPSDWPTPSTSPATTRARRNRNPSST